jgi:hypothetical protein
MPIIETVIAAMISIIPVVKLKLYMLTLRLILRRVPYSADNLVSLMDSHFGVVYIEHIIIYIYDSIRQLCNTVQPR